MKEELFLSFHSGLQSPVPPSPSQPAGTQSPVPALMGRLASPTASRPGLCVAWPACSSGVQQLQCSSMPLSHAAPQRCAAVLYLRERPTVNASMVSFTPGLVRLTTAPTRAPQRPSSSSQSSSPSIRQSTSITTPVLYRSPPCMSSRLFFVNKPVSCRNPTITVPPVILTFQM